MIFVWKIKSTNSSLLKICGYSCAAYARPSLPAKLCARREVGRFSQELLPPSLAAAAAAAARGEVTLRCCDLRGEVESGGGGSGGRCWALQTKWYLFYSYARPFFGYRVTLWQCGHVITRTEEYLPLHIVCGHVITRTEEYLTLNINTIWWH